METLLRSAKSAVKLPSIFGISNAHFINPTSGNVVEAVVVKNGKIAALGTRKDLQKTFPKNCSWIDASGYFVFPGFINSHSHVAMSFMRDLTHDRENVIENFFFTMEKRLNPKLTLPLSYSYIYAGLLSGTTCFVDHFYFSDSIGKALERFGMKGFIGETIADLGGAFPSKTIWEESKRKIENWKFSQRIKPVVCPHATDTISEKLLKNIARYAQTHSLPLHMHLSQTALENQRARKKYGVSAVRFAAECGAVDSNSLLVHLIDVNDKDLQILKDSKATVGFCPSSQILYEKLAPVKKFVEQGIPLVLGTDCAASCDGADMLAELRLTGLLMKDRGCKERDYSVQNLLAMATTIPARFLGMEAYGFETGAPADLVFLREDITNLPVQHATTNLIYSTSHRQIQHVMIDGRWVLWSRKPTQIDLDEISRAYNRAITKIQK